MQKTSVKSFKKKMIALAHELPESKQYVKDIKDRRFKRKQAEQEEARKQQEAMIKEENEIDLMVKSLEKLDVVEKPKEKPKTNDFDDLFNL